MTTSKGRTSQADPARRPTLEILGQPLLERIVAQALDVLRKVGVFVENAEGLALLGDGGARIDPASRRAFIPEELVWRCVRSCPSAVRVFSRHREPAMQLEGWNVHFDPGSAAIKILDTHTGHARPPVTSDLISFARLADALPNIDAQSTALVPSDVPQAVADRYRLYVALLHSVKPIVTGTFTKEGFAVMKEMLTVVAGGETELREFPMAVFDVCPSAPLKWSDLSAQCLLDCARSGIPVEIVSAPLLGASAPITLAGALVQHTAENLSGIVACQLAAEGSPVIYGASPAVFDMRHGTMATGALETGLLTCACAQIGRFLGLPTHGYLGLSDAKLVDAQAGLESGIGAIMAALAGINVVSGAGMLEFESCQSLEKLVIDDEICGMAQRLLRGIEPRGATLAEDLFADLSKGDHFLTSPLTLRWLREESRVPSAPIDRRQREAWHTGGAPDAVHQASQRAEDLLARHRPEPLPDDVQQHLSSIISTDARRHGMDRLPLAL